MVKLMKNVYANGIHAEEDQLVHNPFQPTKFYGPKEESVPLEDPKVCDYDEVSKEEQEEESEKSEEDDKVDELASRTNLDDIVSSKSIIEDALSSKTGDSLTYVSSKFSQASIGASASASQVQVKRLEDKLKRERRKRRKLQSLVEDLQSKHKESVTSEH